MSRTEEQIAKLTSDVQQLHEIVRDMAHGLRVALAAQEHNIPASCLEAAVRADDRARDLLEGPIDPSASGGGSR